MDYWGREPGLIRNPGGSGFWKIWNNGFWNSGFLDSGCGAWTLDSGLDSVIGDFDLYDKILEFWILANYGILELWILGFGSWSSGFWLAK